MIAHDPPLTGAELTATVERLWPGVLVGEHVNLGRRWIGAIIPDGGKWSIEVACPVKRGAWELRPELARRASNTSAARTYLYELGRHIFAHAGVADEVGFGVWIPDIEHP